MKVLRKMEYEKHIIYIMQFSNMFQYLFADKKGNIFQDHIILTPSILNRIKHKLHLIPVPYTKEEMEAGEQIVLSGAMSSIDALIKEEKEEQGVKKIKAIHPKGRIHTNCLWRATEVEAVKKYECLRHGVFVDMVDDVSPFHEVGILSPLQFR